MHMELTLQCDQAPVKGPEGHRCWEEPVQPTGWKGTGMITWMVGWQVSFSWIFRPVRAVNVAMAGYEERV